MPHVNARDGSPIALSESRPVTQIAEHTVLRDGTCATRVPLLEKIVRRQLPASRESVLCSQTFASVGCDRMIRVAR